MDSLTLLALRILLTRLDTLKAAILARDWVEVEFQYDRVLRAAEKARHTEEEK